MRTHKKSLNIRTPQQYGYVLVYKNGWLSESFSVGEFIEEGRPVAVDRKDKKLVEELANYTVSLHEHGMMHRDYILNNVLYTHQGDKYRFVLIDVNRFVFSKKPIRGFLQCVNLMQPFYGQRNTARFVKAYIQKAHAAKSLYWEVLIFRWFRSGYSKLKHLLRKIPGIRLLARYH